MSVITTSSQMSFSARLHGGGAVLARPHHGDLRHQALSIFAITASATSLVPTAVESSRDGFSAS